MLLREKKALVTGAASGIGRAIAIAFVEAGASTAISDINAAGLAETAKIGGAGLREVPFDVSDLDAHAAALDQAGELDILVNNAGIEISEPMLEATSAVWDKTFGVNLKGPFFLAQAVARRWAAAKRGGVILNVASVHDTTPLLHNGIYSFTKAAMGMVTKMLALELAPYQIRVLSISPGAVETPMNRETLANPDLKAAVDALIPMSRFAQPREIAQAAVFAASDMASYMTGSAIYVDGGLLLNT